MNLIAPIAYLAFVTWAIIKSKRRWVVLFWIFAGLAATLGVFAAAAEIWPDLTEVFGHMALIPSLLVSALVGMHHMLPHHQPSVRRNAR
jgi:hypothetical protein